MFSGLLSYCVWLDLTRERWGEYDCYSSFARGVFRIGTRVLSVQSFTSLFEVDIAAVRRCVRAVLDIGQTDGYRPFQDSEPAAYIGADFDLLCDSEAYRVRTEISLLWR